MTKQWRFSRSKSLATDQFSKGERNSRVTAAVFLKRVMAVNEGSKLLDFDEDFKNS